MFLFMIVDQDYRGMQISSTMNKIALEQVKSCGKKYAISTVQPQNIASFKSLARIGFKELYQDKIFKENLLRSIMFMEI